MLLLRGALYETLALSSIKNKPSNFILTDGFLLFFYTVVVHNCTYSCKGIARHSDENEQNRSQVNTKLFRSLLDLPDPLLNTPVVRSNGKNTMLLFCY